MKRRLARNAKLYHKVACMTQTAALLESDIATLIVETLHLEIAPDSIDPQMPLFNEGLGLDSIDALELALALGRRYGVSLKADDVNNKQIFASLRNLAAYVAAQ
jgi:acyl carrier protein